MSLIKSRLTDFLEVVDSELEDTITLVAAGGTALTLLDLKPSTIDVDFTGPVKSLGKLKAVLDRLWPGFRVVYKMVNDNIVIVIFYPVKRKRFNV